MLILVFTVGIKLTFCYGTCDVSTLIGLARHNIYIFHMLECKQSQGIFLKAALYY